MFRRGSGKKCLYYSVICGTLAPASDSLSLGEHGSAGVLVQIKVLVMARGTDAHPVHFAFLRQENRLRRASEGFVL